MSLDELDLPDLSGVGEHTVLLGDRDLAAVTDDALQALTHANSQAPCLFRRGNVLCRVVVDDHGRATIETHSRTTLRYQLARAALWRKMSVSKGGEPRITAVAPPWDTVDDILAAPGWDFPVLDRVTTGPTYAPDGSLVTAAGYHPSGIWHAPAGLLRLDIPDHPSAGQIAAAGHLICDELLGDFAFVGEAERAHAVALLLGCYVRDLIDGPTPLHLIEAPGPGTGKGLLAAVVLGVGLGRIPDPMPAAGDDDEWRKRITTALRMGGPAVVIDNLTGPLDSGSLAAALTARSWSDRLLGANSLVTVPVRCLWAATANNPVTSTEIARRTVRIRLDASVERPWLRDGFRHPNLARWADTNRAQIAAAACTLVQGWLAQGRPAGRHPTLGSFENWSRVVGGILHTAGIPGFLDNLAESYEVGDTETQALTAFTAAWWNHFQDRTVGAADLWPIAGKTQPALPIDGSTERAQRTKFGRWLGTQRGRVIGRYRIAHAGTYQGGTQWRLEHVETGRS
jgi:hypothetical protein